MPRNAKYFLCAFIVHFLRLELKLGVDQGALGQVFPGNPALAVVLEPRLEHVRVFIAGEWVQRYAEIEPFDRLRLDELIQDGEAEAGDWLEGESLDRVHVPAGLG